MRHLPPIFILLLLCLSSPAVAQQSPKPPSLQDLYDRIADDLQAGKPLIFAAHYGMWQVRADQPERNLNWGVYYGHATMLERARRDKHIGKNFQHRQWRRVYKLAQERDPVRTLVFEQTIKAGKRWRDAGVTEPIRAYLVMYAHQSQEGAALAATKTMRQGEGESITLDDGTRLDTASAQVVGYFGHNFFYDYEDFEWDGFSEVAGHPARPTGIFAVGCKTARVPGFDDWIVPNTRVLLFSKTLMASEGYSTLALTDGVLRHLTGKELVGLADRTYQYFQKLGKPDRRVGRPFVSHTYKLYPPHRRRATSK